MTVFALPDVAVDVLKTLSSDGTLMALTVTNDNGETLELEGVFYGAVPQDRQGKKPVIIIQPGFNIEQTGRIHPNGPFRIGGEFGHDVVVECRDVEPDNSGIRAIRGRIETVLEGQTVVVTGGRAAVIYIEGYPPDQRIDKGNYIYTRIGTTFGLRVELT